MVRFLQNSGADLVYADHYGVDDSDELLCLYRVPPPERLLVINCVGPCFAYWRRLHAQIGVYDESFRLAEDYEFWLRASRYFRFERIREPLYRYRKHDNSLTARFSDEIKLVAAKAVMLHAPYIHWASSSQKAEAYSKILHEVPLARDPLFALKCAIQGMIVSRGQLLIVEFSRLFTQIAKGLALTFFFMIAFLKKISPRATNFVRGALHRTLDR